MLGIRDGVSEGIVREQMRGVASRWQRRTFLESILESVSGASVGALRRCLTREPILSKDSVRRVVAVLVVGDLEGFAIGLVDALGAVVVDERKVDVGVVFSDEEEPDCAIVSVDGGSDTLGTTCDCLDFLDLVGDEEAT